MRGNGGREGKEGGQSAGDERRPSGGAGGAPRQGRSSLRIVEGGGGGGRKDWRSVCPGSVSQRAGKQREQSRVLTKNRRVGALITAKRGEPRAGGEGSVPATAGE